jgi:hypothetical protein
MTAAVSFGQPAESNSCAEAPNARVCRGHSCQRFASAGVIVTRRLRARSALTVVLDDPGGVPGAGGACHAAMPVTVWCQRNGVPKGIRWYSCFWSIWSPS